MAKRVPGKEQRTDPNAGHFLMGNDAFYTKFGTGLYTKFDIATADFSFRVIISACFLCFYYHLNASFRSKKKGTGERTIVGISHLRSTPHPAIFIMITYWHYGNTIRTIACRIFCIHSSVRDSQPALHPHIQMYTKRNQSFVIPQSVFHTYSFPILSVFHTYSFPILRSILCPVRDTRIDKSYSCNPSPVPYETNLHYESIPHSCALNQNCLLYTSPSPRD